MPLAQAMHSIPVMSTTKKNGARITKAGNVVGMTKAYAVVCGTTVYETNDLNDAIVEARMYFGVVHSSGGPMMSFKKGE